MKNSASLVYEHHFCEKMKRLCSPTPVEFLGDVPSLEGIMAYLSDENSRVCFIFDGNLKLSHV